MKSRLGFWAIVITVGILSIAASKGGHGIPDLSTPQKSFTAFVDILKAGNVSALPRVATPTGQISLVALYQNESYRDGMTVLGKDLAAAKTSWEEITEDIYFASAIVGQKVHKMEFTKEEPGWMLYHWQIGGGADDQGDTEAPEPQD